MLKKMSGFVANLHTMADDEKRARLRKLLDGVRVRIGPMTTIERRTGVLST